eukprot:TRINITY_DN12107_c0_g1_i1.p1 TRINITY_DN12107_c0_g1~~TRINITY_DN12107_c0_g1_i1.p1  ORF type:complete len:291 (-),score=84.92 TRINITY_DN12107_c0_g1_i1:203-1075(-)
MGDQEKRGDELVAQADKKLKSWGWGSSSKNDDAAELMEKAGTAYKVAKAWDKAGDLYRRLSDLQLKKLDSIHDAASSLVEAGNCYKKTNSKLAVECLTQAVDLFIENGRLSMAARHSKDIAEVFEKEENVDQAVIWFDKAADLYQSENANSSVNQMRLKVAEFSALKEDYLKAAEIFEGVARECVSNNLLKYGAKGHLLNAGICRLCLSPHDATSAKNALDQYQDIDPSFADTREFKLLSNLAAAVDESDVDAFTDAIKEFDSMTRLDGWKTSLLLRVKKGMEAEDESLT